MFRKLTVIVSLVVFGAGPLFANPAGGTDQRHKASNTAQPPDPLVSRKSPGRSKRFRGRHHKPTSNALVVKQKSNLKRD